ncbi:MAG TPA: hypothetical protein VK970_15145 [Candidatus Methylacidiphilales bacterium]|nr:hypothetical protein [Candidatus Methylacidiphilales bacterium]
MPAYPGAPRCFSCQTEISRDALNTPDPVPCARCATPLQAYVFEAQYRGVSGPRTEIAQDEESTCFYHPDKRADLCCDNCGRFICSLCEIDFESQHICPGCLNSAPTKTIKTSLKNEGVNYDWFACLLGLFGPLFCCYVTAPATCFISVRYWNSMTPFSSPFWYRARMVMSLLLGLLLSVVALGYIIGNVYFMTELSKKSRFNQTSSESPGDSESGKSEK